MFKKKSKAKEIAPKKGANKRVQGKTAGGKPTKRSAAKTAKKPQRKPAALKPAKNIFDGAKEISLTENKIAVTRSASRSRNGRYSENLTREYHEKTPENLKALDSVLNNRQLKKVTVQFKSEK